MGAAKAIVRVACVQLAMRNISGRADFYAPIEHYVAIAAGYGADFIVFPEMMTFPLAALAGHDPVATVEALTGETEDFRKRMSAMATRHGVNVLAGSHIARDAGGTVRNTAYLCLRDGRIHAQEKLHPTPDERSVWGVEGGRALDAVETDCGTVGTLVCYDSEFPELGRRLADGGARLILVPFQTDTRAGTMRVSLCSRARAVENQCYMALAGSCGTLRGVANLDINYARSGIYTPCDLPFARDGIAAEAEPNAEQIVLADLDMALLDRARSEGAVRNLADRRPDLYASTWTGD